MERGRIIASVGMLVFATAYPFAPTPVSTVALLAVVNFFAAGAISDYVFRDDAALGSALASVNIIGMGSAIALFLFGMPAFRRTLANRDAWNQ